MGDSFDKIDYIKKEPKIVYDRVSNDIGGTKNGRFDTALSNDTRINLMVKECGLTHIFINANWGNYEKNFINRPSGPKS